MAIIRVIDFETTGLEKPAEVVEVGHCDFDTEARAVLVEGAGSRLCGAASIPPEARMIHHIRHQDVSGLPAFDPEELLAELLKDGVAMVAAHQAEFEAKWIGRTLEGVLPLVCTWKAALRVWPDAPSHSVFGLLYWLEDAGKIAQFSPKLVNPAHRAGPDAFATANILRCMFDVGVTGRTMLQWTREPALLPRCPIGKFRGKPWGEVETGFLRWMLNQADMEPDLKWNASRALDERGA